MNDFFNLCQKIATKVPEWVQGAGGNVSEKFQSGGRNLLRIKASGYRLGDVTPKAGYVDLDLEQVRAEFAGLTGGKEGEEKYAQLLSTHVIARPIECDRASMETSFHIALESRLVVHFHSLAAVLLADIYFGGSEEAKFFVDSQHNLSLIDFVKPGLDLALAVKKAKPSAYYILRNHGVILALDHSSQLDEWVAIEDQMKKIFSWGSLENAVTEKDAELPFKVYLPDTAVFLKKFANELMKSSTVEGAFLLKSRDPNLLELWQATGMMYRAYPELQEIPHGLWSEIAGLPTEQFRFLRNEGY